jgi:hypothetical protein
MILIKVSCYPTMAVNFCAPRIYIYSYEKTSLELCEVFRNASLA